MKRVISNLSQWQNLTLLVLKRWEKSTKPFTVTIGKPKKTLEQLGYLHSEVLPKFTQAMYDAGEIRNNSEREAKYLLKVLIDYGKWIAFNDVHVFDPDSFADADMETLILAIDTAISEAAKRDVIILPPRKK